VTAFWRLVCRLLDHRWVKVGERDRRGAGNFVIAIEMCTRCDKRRNRLTVRRVL